ncbi:MAG: 3-deoxy-D-manno-octulosonic acid transferase [Desulfatibacillaceae bacterium]
MDNRTPPGDWAYRVYAGLTGLAYLGGVLPAVAGINLAGRDRWRLYERLGRYPDAVAKRFRGPCPRVWLHAVSVGEVAAARPIVQSLRAICPECDILLTTTTIHGLEHARRLFPNSMAATALAPVDALIPVRRALRAVRPDVLAMMETEIWPNWLLEAKRQGARCCLVNGRISARSIGGYRKIQPLVRTVLSRMDAFGMTGHGDARRIRSLGAPEGRVRVCGNAKFDLPADLADPALAEQARRFVSGNGPVLVAGSTRRGEEAALLRVFRDVRQRFLGATLVLAPRHPGRVGAVEEMIRAAGFSHDLLSRIESGAASPSGPVLLVDTMGRLFSLYGVADVVFCGGSLVPLGGQNVIEPAVWGKPVLFGPHTEDFRQAVAMLQQAGGGRTARSVAGLRDVVLDLLENPDRAKEMGEQARRAVAAHRGAAGSYGKMLAGLALDRARERRSEGM